MRKAALLSCLACVFAGAAAAQGIEVKLTVKETAQAARSPGLITMGVPFARGAVKDVALKCEKAAAAEPADKKSPD